MRAVACLLQAVAALRVSRGAADATPRRRPHWEAWFLGQSISPSEDILWRARKAALRRRLTDDASAPDTCEDLFDAYASCKLGDDDAVAGAGRRLEEEEEGDDEPFLKTDVTCEDLLSLAAASEDPCHDGIYDDGDAGCEVELFDAYSCYFTDTCGEEFRCEEFDPDKIYDHESNQTLLVPQDYEGPTTILTFYNSFPTIDYSICFTYGPSAASRHARTAGPLRYGEALHAKFEGSVVYFNVHTVTPHTVSPTSVDCADESRVRVTENTVIVDAHRTSTNFIGWGTSESGSGAVDLWRTSFQVDKVNETVFANEAVAFGDCAFRWGRTTEPPHEAVPDPADGASLPIDTAAVVEVASYAGLATLTVSCDDGSEYALDIDASKFCADAGQHFLAVGNRLKGIFPLQIMLIQGNLCNGQDLDEVEAPEVTPLPLPNPTSLPVNDDFTPQDEGYSTSKDKASKKDSSSKENSYIIVIVVLVVCLVVLCALVAYRERRIAKRSYPFAPTWQRTQGMHDDDGDEVAGIREERKYNLDERNCNLEMPMVGADEPNPVI